MYAAVRIPYVQRKKDTIRHPSNQRHHGKAAKTCSIKDAWDEMSDKRKGRDKTIDHELTKDNVWLCGNTDMDMEQAIQSEIDRINAIRAEHGKRKMRIDAVSAIEMIQKPPIQKRQSYRSPGGCDQGRVRGTKESTG